MTFRTMAMLMGPDAGAGGGGAGAGAAGAGAAGGAAAGGGAAGAGAGAGAAGGKGAAGSSAGAGAGAGEGGGKTEDFEEWEDGGRKYRVSRSAMRIAHQREAATSNKARELAERQRRLDAADAEREEFEALLERGEVEKILDGRFKGDKVALFAKLFKASVEHENKMLDPAQRELLEKAKEADSLRAKVKGYERAEADAKINAEVTKRLEAISERYMPALDKLGLPKNDITVALMRGDDRANQRLGLNLSPEALAESTRGALVEMVDKGLTKDMTPAQAVMAFPTLARLIHKGLIEAEMGRRNGTVAKPVVNAKKAAAAGGDGQQKNGEGDGKPQVMNSAQIREKTGLWNI